jgi:hypothetical protein
MPTSKPKAVCALRTPKSKTKKRVATPTLVLQFEAAFEFAVAFDLPSPVPPPSADWSGLVGENCLSTWTRSGSCEFRSRLASLQYAASRLIAVETNL